MFGTIAVALFFAHAVADHWVQTDTQAQTKSQPTWAGRFYCLLHVTSHTATLAIALAAVWIKFDLDLNLTTVLIGLAINAITHYIADRRTPLQRIAEFVGVGEFYQLKTAGINGAYLLDQSWHLAWLFIVALIIT